MIRTPDRSRERRAKIIDVLEFISASVRLLLPPRCAGRMRALLVRGGAVWQLVGLITRRSQVQILPPLPKPSIDPRIVMIRHEN